MIRTISEICADAQISAVEGLKKRGERDTRAVWNQATSNGGATMAGNEEKERRTMIAMGRRGGKTALTRAAIERLQRVKTCDVCGADLAVGGLCPGACDYCGAHENCHVE